MTTSSHVTFCMEWMPSYRLHFYEALRPKLEEAGVGMSVVHGLPPASRSRRQDHIEPDWAELIENRIIEVKGVEITWQPVWKYAQNADLLVVQQEAAHLFNYYALARRRFGGPKVALWGHGENPDPAQVNPLAEAIKRRTTPFADWFFAYTERSGKIFQDLGIPDSRITVVNNSRSHDNALANASDASPDIIRLCREVSYRTTNVGWMASALDDSKRLPFLIATLDAIRELVGDFEFFVLGRGPLEHIVFDAAEERSWLHAVGAKFGSDKVAIGQLASIMLHPGLLGLHVIDGFAFETPIVTTEFVSHSHEFDYLADGVNSRVLPSDASADELANAAIAALSAESLPTLQAGCRETADVYSLEAMVKRFSAGILSATTADR